MSMTPDKWNELAKNLEETRVRLQKLEEKATARSKVKCSPVPKYSPEIIRHYREMERDHAFLRDIKATVPVDLIYDEVTLSCGHTQQVMSNLIEAMANGRYRCDQCITEWLAKAVEEEQGSKS
jgi:hypothetical protein